MSKFSVIHTEDPKMLQTIKVAENIASSRASVLLYGESGSGKELLARYIHAKSNRSDKDFFAINCAALPDGLLESELFGFEKGAFTGANNTKLGKFEQADGSTFLLDEISELPLLLQAKLLRVLQEGEVERLGSNKVTKVNVRILATTNKNLQEMCERGEFREDLYYRLNVIPLEIPPLRERPRDIELLMQFFMEITCAENGIQRKHFTKSAKRKLMEWNWPGNIRELKNVIERSVLLTQNLELNHERILVQTGSAQKSDGGLVPGMTVAEAEKKLILKTLTYTSQNRTRAANLLGISIRTLRNKIRDYKQETVSL